MPKKKIYKGYHVNPEQGSWFDDNGNQHEGTVWEIYDVKREKVVGIEPTIDRVKARINEDIAEQAALDGNSTRYSNFPESPPETQEEIEAAERLRAFLESVPLTKGNPDDETIPYPTHGMHVVGFGNAPEFEPSEPEYYVELPVSENGHIARSVRPMQPIYEDYEKRWLVAPTNMEEMRIRREAFPRGVFETSYGNPVVAGENDPFVFNDFASAKQFAEFYQGNLPWYIVEASRFDPNWRGYILTRGNLVSGVLTRAQMEVLAGNPGEQPLMTTLDQLGQFVDYEAEVVRTAAEEITDATIQKEALQQAEYMDDAAEALHDAAEQAAETAGEVYVETGIPAVENDAQVIAGNQGMNPGTYVWPVDIRDDEEDTVQGNPMGGIVPMVGPGQQPNPVALSQSNAMMQAYRESQQQERPRRVGPITGQEAMYPVYSGNPETPLQMQQARELAILRAQQRAREKAAKGNPVTQPNAPVSRQTAGQSLQQGTGSPGQRAVQPQAIVGTGNPVIGPPVETASIGISNRAAGGARGVISGNPGDPSSDPGASIYALKAERERVAGLNWRPDAGGESQRDHVLQKIDEAISALESSDEFAYVTEGNPEIPEEVREVIEDMTPEAIEEIVEEAAERETITEDEAPVIDHWYFRTRKAPAFLRSK